MAVNILGVVIILIFYVAIVIVGIFAAKRFPLGSRNGGSRIELSMVAGRNLSLGVAMFTMAGKRSDVVTIRIPRLMYTVYPFCMLHVEVREDCAVCLA